MRTVQVEELSADAFLPFGFYARLIDPAAEKIGAPPIDFYRDMVQQDLGGASAVSYSTCRVEKREPVIDVTEYHTATGEGILPLDNDALIHVGPASPGDVPPLNRFRVFRVPKGTMAVLRPGVWHHAPFTVNDEPANVLIALPERTYANDCRVVELAGDDRIRVAGGE
ncbi:MAG: ureidoglycolate lyase [Kiritimatiellae bacterium]|nr:ureidoglycolate lyase [Kiritimatiellia bacterium]